MFKFQSGSQSAAAAERIWLLTFCGIYSAGLYFKSWCLFSVALDTVALPPWQMGWACATGQVRIFPVFYMFKFLIYWQLKTPQTSPPASFLFSHLLRAGWGDGGTQGWGSVLLHLLFCMFPLSSCAGIILGFYHHCLSKFPQRCWEALVAGWVLAHGGSLGEPAADSTGQPWQPTTEEVSLQPPMAKTLWNTIPDPLISGGRRTTHPLACDTGKIPSLIILYLGVWLVMVEGLCLCSGGAVSRPCVGWLMSSQSALAWVFRVFWGKTLRI